MGIFSKLKKPDPEKEANLREQIDREGGLEKGDLPAMILSAMLVIMPVAIIVLILLAILVFLMI